MSEIVERLRAWGPMVSSGYECPAAGTVMHEAAARIEQLEAALRWFMDEYEKVQAARRAVVHAPECRCVLCAYDNARAALGGGDE